MSLPQFELMPSIGLSEIKLGTNLHTILRQLAHLHLQVSYSPSKTLLLDPVTVTVKKYGIRMTFEPDRQLLCLIELLDFKKVEVMYKGKMVRDKGFRTLYDHYMGPTYPGEVLDGFYILSYPGLSFKFAMSDDVSDEGGDKTLEALLEKNPRAQSVVVHQLSKWSEYSDVDAAYPTMKRLCSDAIDVDMLKIDREMGCISVLFYKHPSLKNFELILNKSLQQDILLALGPPDEVFNKNDSRTLIHNSDRDHGVTTASVFHNYFRFGFDLLYNTTRTGSVLSKVIIHSNIPINVMFGKYAKCSWVMERDELVLSSEIAFSKMKVVSRGTTPAIVINRNEMLSNSIELLEDAPEDGDENEIKWGKSMVYALEGEIWDVVDDCVNSLTLY